MATLLANAGGTVFDLKRHGRWRSGSVAETYMRDSERAETEIARKLARGLDGERLVAASSRETDGPPMLADDGEDLAGAITEDSSIESRRSCVVLRNCKITHCSFMGLKPPISKDV